MPLVTFDDRNVESEIYEKGSNSLGSWIKYTDGTMICWQRYGVSFTGVSGWGTAYYKRVNSQNFPQTFTTVPTVTMNVETNNMEGWFGTIGNATVSKPCDINFFRPATGSTACVATFNVIAIGKWK